MFLRLVNFGRRLWRLGLCAFYGARMSKGKKFANIRPGYVPKVKYGNKKTVVDGITFDSICTNIPAGAGEPTEIVEAFGFPVAKVYHKLVALCTDAELQAALENKSWIA